jgi:hypothetical protein
MYDNFARELIYIEPHEREEGTMFDRSKVAIAIPGEHFHELAKVMEEHGLFVPKMTQATRDPDLKIIHRLIDIIEKDGGHHEETIIKHERI